MTAKKSDIPNIECIEFRHLVVDPVYSGRDKKEITANAKELAPEIEAFGGWDATQPGQYFIGADKKKHVVAGFTRIAACESIGMKSGYFVLRDGDEISHLLACIQTNGGKPLSQKCQGALYVNLRDGSKPEDTKVGEEVREPMGIKEISKLVGKGIQHITNCIAIHEAPEIIKPLIEDDLVSSNAFTVASSGIKSDSVKLAILKAAIQNAKLEGLNRATEKHVKAVKAQFIEPAPLKAAKKDEKQAEAASTSPSSESKDEAKGEPAEDKTDVPFSSVTVGDVMLNLEETAHPKPKVSHAKQKADLGNLLEECFPDANGVAIGLATVRILEMFSTVPF